MPPLTATRRKKYLSTLNDVSDAVTQLVFALKKHNIEPNFTISIAEDQFFQLQRQCAEDFEFMRPQASLMSLEKKFRLQIMGIKFKCDPMTKPQSRPFDETPSFDEE